MFATFYGKFPRVTAEYELNFTRGTYVELELRGQDARVWIDNFDPQIRCSYACADLSGEGGVSSRDFLLALAEAGQTVQERQSQPGTAKWIGCIDNRLSEDGYVDISDVLAFDSVIQIPSPPHACGPFEPPTLSAPLQTVSSEDPLANAAGQAQDPHPTGGGTSLGLVVAGKTDSQADALYAIDQTTGSSAACPQNPVGGAGTRSNGRLIRDGSGRLYQLNAGQGLVHLDGTLVAGAQYFASVSIDGVAGCDVHVGLNAPGGVYVGLPLIDAAFNPAEADPTSVYVVPVLVTPPAGSGRCPYKAAARLDLAGGGNYSLGAIYGKDPYTYSTVLPSDCDEVTAFGFVWEPDRQPVREIEVDSSGNVYVLAAQAVNGTNDWLLIYSSTGGNASEVPIQLSVPGPAAMLVAGNQLYLASTLAAQAIAPTLPTTRVYRLTTQGQTQGYTDVAHPVSGTPDPGYGHIATITALAEAEGRIYAVGYSAPRFNNEKDFTGSEPLFTTPTLATFAPGDNTVTASALSVHGLALPLSAAFGTISTGSGIPADLTCDAHVDSADLEVFRSCASGPAVPFTSNCASSDFDKDGDVDMNDFAVLQRCYGGPNVAADPSCVN